MRRRALARGQGKRTKGDTSRGAVDPIQYCGPRAARARGSAVSGGAHLTFHFRHSNYTIVELERMSIESFKLRLSVAAWRQ
jgi:hypothetical protein